jgi:hypothetical protein
MNFSPESPVMQPLPLVDGQVSLRKRGVGNSYARYHAWRSNSTATVFPPLTKTPMHSPDLGW